MYKIDLKLSAKEDLKNIKEYIFRMSFSIDTANKIYNEIMANILTLKVIPSSYPIFNRWFKSSLNKSIIINIIDFYFFSNMRKNYINLVDVGDMIV